VTSGPRQWKAPGLHGVVTCKLELVQPLELQGDPFSDLRVALQQVECNTPLTTRKQARRANCLPRKQTSSGMRTARRAQTGTGEKGIGLMARALRGRFKEAGSLPGQPDRQRTQFL
jgi:hypothetical protein